MITTLKDNEVFVFGSNLAGRHGAGAAKQALISFGAKYGQGVGMQGKSYGIPTKDENLDVLFLSEIKPYIEEFITYAEKHPEKTFLVTEIGCGLAGFTPNDMRPLFKRAIEVENIVLPESFKD